MKGLDLLAREKTFHARSSCNKGYCGKMALLWILIVMLIDASIVCLHYCD